MQPGATTCALRGCYELDAVGTHVGMGAMAADRRGAARNRHPSPCGGRHRPLSERFLSTTEVPPVVRDPRNWLGDDGALIIELVLTEAAGTVGVPERRRPPSGANQ